MLFCVLKHCYMSLHTKMGLTISPIQHVDMVLADEKVSVFTYEYIILYLDSEKASD
jgi:hypothetical protein